MLKAYHQEVFIEAGCDEAGRGCYAGPVFAAAVILPKDFYHPELNDSKQLTAEQRFMLRTYIEANSICHAVGVVTHKEIDKINILNASFKAMHIAIKKLPVFPELLLIDGNRFKKYKKVNHQCIIKGDGIYASIAAASVLAKTYRDDFMTELHNKHPHYNWKSNKGYGTEEHRKAIEEHGLCKYHRKSFAIMPYYFNYETTTSEQVEISIKVIQQPAALLQEEQGVQVSDTTMLHNAMQPAT